MPDAVVAVIRLKDGRIGVLPFAEAYRIHVEDELKSLGEFQTLDFPDFHTETLPNGIKSGDLDGIVCEETKEIEIADTQYPLHIYNADYDKVYEAIEKLSLT